MSKFSVSVSPETAGLPLGNIVGDTSGRCQCCRQPLPSPDDRDGHDQRRLVSILRRHDKEIEESTCGCCNMPLMTAPPTAETRYRWKQREETPVQPERLYMREGEGQENDVQAFLHTVVVRVLARYPDATGYTPILLRRALARMK